MSCGVLAGQPGALAPRGGEGSPPVSLSRSALGAVLSPPRRDPGRYSYSMRVMHARHACASFMRMLFFDFCETKPISTHARILHAHALFRFLRNKPNFPFTDVPKWPMSI
jgi:hypothetical protein